MAYKGRLAFLFVTLFVAIAIRVVSESIETCCDQPVCTHKIGSLPFPEIFADFKSLAADFYTVRLLHSDWKCCECGADCFFDQTKLITELDPHFNFIYRFAWLVLTINLKRPDLANELIKRGLRSKFNKDDWRFNFYISCNERFFLGGAQSEAIGVDQNLVCDKKNPLKADWPERPRGL